MRFESQDLHVRLGRLGAAGHRHAKVWRIDLAGVGWDEIVRSARRRWTGERGPPVAVAGERAAVAGRCSRATVERIPLDVHGRRLGPSVTDGRRRGSDDHDLALGIGIGVVGLARLGLGHGRRTRRRDCCSGDHLLR